MNRRWFLKLLPAAGALVGLTPKLTAGQISGTEIAKRQLNSGVAIARAEWRAGMEYQRAYNRALSEQVELMDLQLAFPPWAVFPMNTPAFECAPIECKTIKIWPPIVPRTDGQ